MTEAQRKDAIHRLTFVVRRIRETKAAIEANCGWDCHSDANVANVELVIGLLQAAEPVVQTDGAQSICTPDEVAAGIVSALSHYLPDAEAHRNTARDVIANILRTLHVAGV